MWARNATAMGSPKAASRGPETRPAGTPKASATRCSLWQKSSAPGEFARLGYAKPSCGVKRMDVGGGATVVNATACERRGWLSRAPPPLHTSPTSPAPPSVHALRPPIQQPLRGSGVESQRCSQPNFGESSHVTDRKGSRRTLHVKRSRPVSDQEDRVWHGTPRQRSHVGPRCGARARLVRCQRPTGGPEHAA